MIHGRGVANPSFRQRTAYHAMLLGGMAMITSALIVIGNKQTYADIELRRAEDVKRSLSQVIHPDMYTNDLLGDVVQLHINDETKTVHIARSDNKVVAVAFEMVSEGYSGAITVMIGINRKGELLGARVLSHSETPGLGDKIEAEKSNWIFSFDGLSLASPGEAQWKVKKDGGYFDQFTGATITPRAVVKAIKTGLEIFKANQAVLLAETKPPNSETSSEPPDKPSVQKSSPATKPAAEAKDINKGKLQTETQTRVIERGKSSG
ncbi:MAG: electron transport complex subunit RsxG [Gammaproteobacteria bacterium]